MILQFGPIRFDALLASLLRYHLFRFDACRIVLFWLHSIRLEFMRPPLRDVPDAVTCVSVACDVAQVDLT